MWLRFSGLYRVQLSGFGVHRLGLRLHQPCLKKLVALGFWCPDHSVGLPRHNGGRTYGFDYGEASHTKPYILCTAFGKLLVLSRDVSDIIM